MNCEPSRSAARSSPRTIAISPSQICRHWTSIAPYWQRSPPRCRKWPISAPPLRAPVRPLARRRHAAHRLQGHGRSVRGDRGYGRRRPGRGHLAAQRVQAAARGNRAWRWTSRPPYGRRGWPRCCGWCRTSWSVRPRPKRSLRSISAPGTIRDRSCGGSACRRSATAARSNRWLRHRSRPTPRRYRLQGRQCPALQALVGGVMKQMKGANAQVVAEVLRELLDN